ncbi:TonB-dependent receptor domain-containing protein [Aquabacterium humicola]|uniref:TonB-dependent receptor domain-containing protein n=1 Tax=Aquabacterium humicola TaxID=3237377 RepID=UPI0025426BB4|nr:TonB-dependent receptor [Rubrivivax pictus]
MSFRSSPRRAVAPRTSLPVVALAAIAATALPAGAQSSKPPAEPIVVVGAREPLPASKVAADVVVIDAERINRSTADSIEDLLRREAGVQVSRNGGPGANASLFIRGAGSGNTLVLVDGVRIGSATLGYAEMESLPLAAIERIEVLRGPASSLYGADGSGGVVQIFTRRGDGVPYASARVAAGGYGAREGSLHAGASFGAVDLAGGVSHERLEGESTLRPNDRFGNHNPDADGFRRTSAQARLGWQPTKDHRVEAMWLETRLNSQYDASEFLPPTYAQDPSPDFRNRLETQVGALSWHGRWGSDWTSLLRFATQEGDSHTGGRQIDRFRTQRRQLDAQATWRIAAEQRLTVAYEGLREEALSTSYLGDVARDNDALVLAYAGSFNGLSMQADLRRDDNSVYGGVNTGRLGASYALAAGWRVRALAGQSFKAPSFNDLYYPGYGVATIRPERSKSFEFGIDGRWSGAHVSATAWRTRARDLVAYEADNARCPNDPGYSYGCAANIGRARLEGLSLNGGLQAGPWQGRAAIDFLDAKDADTNQRLQRRAAHQASVSLDYDAGPWLIGVAALNVGDRPDGGKTMAAYTTIDLRARWRFAPQWQLEAKVLNATDRDIEPVRDYQALGRQGWIGVRWDFAGR